MDTMEKVAAIEKSGLMLAFDGCHKVYYCQTKADEDEARDTGYDLFRAEDLRSILDKSCGLEFVHPWSLNDHPWNIQQGDLDEAGYYGIPKDRSCEWCAGDVEDGEEHGEGICGGWL
jgi:hypothetical protein